MKPHNTPFQIKPHIHVPYDSVDRYLPFIKKEELNLEIYFGSRTFDSVTKEDILILQNKLDYNPALSIHAPFMDLSPGAVDLKIRDVTIKRFLDVIDFAEILKPRVIVFHSGYDKRKFDGRVDIWLEGSLVTWGIINKRAADIGVRIAIENIFEDEPGNLKQLAGEMNSENFGLCFDTGHFNLFSSLPLATWLELIKMYIVELHLHDNSRYADHHLPIGDGDFDFATLFRKIDGIDCVYTIEAHTIEHVRTSMSRLREYFP